MERVEGVVAPVDIVSAQNVDIEYLIKWEHHV